MAYLYLLMVVWVVLQVFLPANPQRRGDRAVGSGGFFPLPVIIACLFFVVGVLPMLEMQVR
jgi:hypothetical protein